jgi:hypothetical protein
MDNDTVLVRLGGLCGILFVILLVPASSPRAQTCPMLA